MKPNAKKLMAMSKKPSGEVLVTHANVERQPGETDAELAAIYRACRDAVATEILPATEEAFADFVRRHGGRPLFPTLAAYPAARD